MNFLVSTAYAMAPSGGAGGTTQSSLLTTLLPLIIIFAIFYLLMIRPQQKQQKKYREMLSTIKKGDRVVTRGGMHGVIHGIAENIVTIEVADNVKIRFSRDAIAAIQNQNEQKE